MHEINHKTVTAALDPQIRKQLLTRSDATGIKQTACHFGLIFLSGLYIYSGLPGWPLMLVLHGILTIFLFTALHESIHGTVFKTSWMNTALAQLCGVIIFLPALWFKQFHFAHHRHTNMPQKDPELAQPKPQTLYDYCKYLSGLPVWYFHGKTIIINALGRNNDSFVAKNHRHPITIEARIYLLVYFVLALISLVFQWTALFWLWLLPVVLGQPFLRAYLLAEHALCPEVNNMLVNSRTTLTTWFVRLIAWNMPYHAEHHSLPSVPFHKLPAFHVYLKEHLFVLENGYTAFHRKMLKHVR